MVEEMGRSWAWGYGGMGLGGEDWEEKVELQWKKKIKGNNHLNNWTTNKIYFFSITFKLQYTAKDGSAL